MDYATCAISGCGTIVLIEGIDTWQAHEAGVMFVCADCSPRVHLAHRNQ